MLTELLAQCAQVTVPEASEQAMRFYNSGNILWIVQQVWGFVIPLLFLARGFTGKLSLFSEKIGKNWYFSIVAYLFFFVVLYQILNFPIAFYAGYLRLHEYDLSTQTVTRWFSNYGKATGITFLTAAVFVWIFYLLLKKSPKRWWLYGSLASTAIGFFMMFVQPIWIDPLFNDFGPMKDKQLEQQILQIASKAGIEGSRVLEVNKSQDTKMLNAYVIGFGSSKRIVLWDTLIQQMTPEQILFVMGHEMGHYVLGHLWWFFLYIAVLSFALFYLTYKTATFLVGKYHARFGFTRLSNIASLPLLLLLLGVFSLATDPLSNYISRYMEHQADVFGLEITHNNQAAGEVFLVLQQKNLANPRPGNLFKFWRATHPPLGERIDFANSYCPWTKEE
jgi:STE24 endopeptidase